MDFADHQSGLLLPAQHVRGHAPIDAMYHYLTASDVLGGAPAATEVGEHLARVPLAVVLLKLAIIMAALREPGTNRSAVDARTRVTNQGLLADPDIDPLEVLAIEELEMVEGLHESAGATRGTCSPRSSTATSGRTASPTTWADVCLLMLTGCVPFGCDCTRGQLSPWTWCTTSGLLSVAS